MYVYKLINQFFSLLFFKYLILRRVYFIWFRILLSMPVCCCF
nr:MAG TPA: hypothetical protein [Caudoviricetes sp.]